MTCCGRSRAASGRTYRPFPHAAPPPPAPPPSAAAPSAAPAPAAATPPGTVRLQFTRQAGVRVRGPVSGVHYDFSGSAPVQPVDARDADGLLRTGYFRRAY